MAGGSLLLLLDDIATIMDDVAVMTKRAAAKTAGVVGDDLALNAEQVTGVVAERELPVVWAVAKGSFLNKLILVPAALAINAFIPWLVTPLLMLGGLYLCYEGVEKVLHSLLHAKKKKHGPVEKIKGITPPKVDEKAKIKGAIRTDFVLSAEIIVITLGVVAANDFLTQVFTLSIVALAITVIVYGLVAGIVKLDDIGLYLSGKTGFLHHLGNGITWAAPLLMKGLSIVGTAAMFLVGGQILVHGIPAFHHWVEDIAALSGAAFDGVAEILLNAITGILAGAITVGVVTLINRLRKDPSPAH